MGWTVPWFSCSESDFNVDFGVTKGQSEGCGTNVFFRDGDNVFRTYFTTRRGDEMLGTVWAFLDLTPLGRQETGEGSPGGWPQTRRYVNGGVVTTSTKQKLALTVLHKR